MRRLWAWVESSHPDGGAHRTTLRLLALQAESLTLENLGMKAAFDSNSADFSAMIGNKNLLISAAIHKAYIDLDENGTEAAAATAVVMAMATAVQSRTPPPPPIVFTADHPFLFLIRDNESGGILFMGRVVDPTK